MDIGLEAKDFGERMLYVDKFCSLVSGWPGEVPARLKTMSTFIGSSAPDRGDLDDTFSNATHVQGTSSSVAAVEAVLYPYYCQTFFNYFGRAPSLPHVLPLETA
jgi:hypothetical protein